ncbi:MAG: hypothetical protein GY943_23770 [Chloroflexi bacterium]|nr:hypothetical protein [Chloroflexota bacterium]
MKTFTGLCPHCAQVGSWQFPNKVALHFPPTGDDYTWAETEASTTCNHCQKPVKPRVQASLDGTVQQLVVSPFPTCQDWHYYVVAWTHGIHPNDRIIKVIHFAPTQEEAEEQNSGYKVLNLNPDGYSTLDGEPCPPHTRDQIHYHLAFDTRDES